MLPGPETARPPRFAQITVAVGVTIVILAAAALLMTGLFSGQARGSGNALTGTDAAIATTPDPEASATPTTTPTPAPTTVPPAAPTTARTTVPAAPKTTKTKAPVASGNTAFEAAVLTKVNEERAKVNCAPLTADSRLTTAARAHSADMAARDYFSHDTPEGVSFATRITNAGYRWSGAAENIAAGQKDPTAVMTSWMNSAGHKANILNCGYKNLGVGLAYNAKNTPYWTQDFGSPL